MSRLSSDAAVRRRFKRLLQTLLIAAVTAFIGYVSQLHQGIPAAQQLQTPAGSYQVVDTADGDTIYVSMDGIKEKVRLVGVDTPETHHPTKPVQCYGKEASAYTASLVKNKAVTLRSDTKQPNRDKYGRLLRYVYLQDGRELNELLVTGGYAFVTNFSTEKKAALQQLQAVAKANRIGLWGACTVITNGPYLQTNNVAQ